MRSVCYRHGVVRQKGPLLVSVHEVDQKTGEHVWPVIAGAGSDIPAVLDDARVPIARGLAVAFPPAGMLDPAGQVMLVGPHTVGIEAALVNQRRHLPRELPFTGVRGGVAGAFEHVSEGYLACNVVFGRPGNRAPAPAGELVHPVVVAILAGHDLKARRVAERRGVARLKLYARLRQTVEIGCAMLRIAIAGQFFGPEIVGHDDNKVRRPFADPLA